VLGNHPYPVYVASIGASAVLAYGGMWWLGRQLGLSRWASHLPAFVVVTAAYYLTDAYARGAWPEFVALSAVPMFLAGAARLLTARWRPWSVGLFVLGAVVMTGSHNITLFWSVLVIGPIAVAAWVAGGSSRPSPRRILAVAGLAAMAVGINAWFLALDVLHSTDSQAWTQGFVFVERFFVEYLYFDNLGNVLDPLRDTPAQSTTYGLTIAAPVAAFAFSLALTTLAWPGLRRASRALQALWLILLAAMVLLVVLMVMPGSWWFALGAPFTNIQFPYRLAGWLLLAIALQLAISLRFAQGLIGRRRRVAVGLGLALVVLTVVQASAQVYSAPRLHEDLTWNFHPRQEAFIQGPTTPPTTYYGERYYADGSQPVVDVPPGRTISLRVPDPGQTRLVDRVTLPRGPGPIATNIAAGPYVVRVEGMKLVGRTREGLMVVEPRRGHGKTARLVVVADAGVEQLVAGIISILCLVACLGLVAVLTVRSRLRYRRGPV
jgi:hypothetical protein